MTSSDKRRARLDHIPPCGSMELICMYPMGEDVYLVDRQGEISLADGATLKSLLRQLSGKDALP